MVAQNNMLVNPATYRIIHQVKLPRCARLVAKKNDMRRSNMLQTAIEAARQAGQLIAERFLGPHDIIIKGYREIVTEVDTAAESVIINLIHERFSNHAILSEESGESGGGGEYTWVVDPLDGTTNYARRIPAFATSIGVLERGEPAVGVVYDPLRDQLFTAKRGKGATLNGEPIHTSQVARLSQALVGLDWGQGDEERERTLGILLRVAPRCLTVRALGSAVLMQCHLAAGWLDGYFNLMLKPWDAAAGTLIIAEAGGRCTTMGGEPYRVGVSGCLATNSPIHDEMLAVIANSPTR
jgi:myo-inositol-1(or 4)-monophosphatase